MQPSKPNRMDSANQSGLTRVGWFGAVMGASTWMLCAGVILIEHGETLAGMMPMASGLLTLAAGFAVWKRRDRFSIRNAMIVLLTITLVTVSIAIAGTCWITSSDMLARFHWPKNPIPMMTFLTLVLGAGIWTNYTPVTRQDLSETR